MLWLANFNPLNGLNNKFSIHLKRSGLGESEPTPMNKDP